MVRMSRQSGRTSKIALFAATQLFEVGQVVVTDHTSFEYKSSRNDTQMYLVDKIKRIYHAINSRDTDEYEIHHNIIPAGQRGRNDFMVVHLWVEFKKKRKNTEDEEVEWIKLKDYE
jgi:hypothetical protein